MLRIAWEKNPDYRFFQLLSALGIYIKDVDQFFDEDRDLEDVLTKSPMIK